MVANAIDKKQLNDSSQIDPGFNIWKTRTTAMLCWKMHLNAGIPWQEAPKKTRE